MRKSPLRFSSFIKSSLLVALVVLCMAPSLSFGPFPVFPIRTDRDQVNLLVAIHRAIPATLNSDVFFNREIPELFREQRRVRGLLEDDPTNNRAYAALEAQRPHPFHLTITAKDKPAEAVEAKALDPRAIDDWQSSLRSAIYSVGDSSDDLRAFHEKLVKRMSTGSLEWYSKGIPQLAIFLDRYLKSGSKESLPGFREYVSHVSEGDLDYLKETVIVDAVLKEYTGGDTSRIREFQGSISRFLKDIHERSVKTSTVFKGTVSVEDVGPDVAIFRGFFGNDCSTMLSFPYPYSPLERTFFLFDQDRNRLGYGAGTHVMFNGRPAFYFHTINGPWINSAQVEQIINGLYRAREQLGVDAILLPTEGRARDNINFDPVESVFVKLIRQSEKRKGDVVHLDSSIRGIFHEASRGHYDLERNNNIGFEYIPQGNPEETSSLTVTMNPHDIVTPLKEGEEVSAAEILLLAHGLSRARGRADSAKWVLKTYGLGEKEWNEYRELISSSHASGQAGLDTIHKSLVKWGMNSEQADIAMVKYADYFNGASLPDYFAPPPPPRPSFYSSNYISKLSEGEANFLTDRLFSAETVAGLQYPVRRLGESELPEKVVLRIISGIDKASPRTLGAVAEILKSAKITKTAEIERYLRQLTMNQDAAKRDLANAVLPRLRAPEDSCSRGLHKGGWGDDDEDWMSWED